MKLITGAIALIAVLFAGTTGAAGKRTVRMQIDLPNGGSPQLKVYEGETATIRMNGGGTYGFVPSFAEGAESVVEIAIFDLAATPDKQLGTVEVAVGGTPVKWETSPVFSLRVLDVKAQ